MLQEGEAAVPEEMKERISNFFYYHKGKLFAIAAACVLLVYGIMTDALISENGDCFV